MTTSTAARGDDPRPARSPALPRMMRHLWQSAGALAVFVVLLGASSLWIDARERDAAALSTLTVRNEARLAAIQATLQDAELGQRGYLLTGDAYYLQPYTRAIEAIGGQLGDLDAALDDDPRQGGSLAVLRSLATQKLSQLRQSVERRRSGDEAGAIAMLRSGQGAVLMDGVRDVVAQMRSEEEETTTARAEAARRAAFRMEVAIVALSLLLAALAFVALRTTLRRARSAEASRDEILSHLDRRLMAVLAADIVGYSGAMERDEAGTLARLRALRDRVDPIIAKHGGSITGTAGDSVLAVFSSALAAVDCAVEMQGLPEARDAGAMRFRVGVNVGDVIRQEGDVFGDTVNVAARLEALAEPGGICVSRAVRDHVGKQRRFDFEDLGLKAVKNIAEPISAHRIRIDDTPPSR